MDTRIAEHRQKIDARILSIVRAKVGDDAIALLWRTETRTGADIPMFVSMNPTTQEKLLALGLEIA